MTKQTLLLFGALTTVALASAVDIRNDLVQGAALTHLFSEVLVAASAVLMLAGLAVRVRSQGRLLTALQAELEAAKQAATRAGPETREARQRLSGLIRQQFQQWQLTTSEQEVALLMLKGLSLREIATLRSTLEKTVRQQASTIYKKASLPGRHALAAWFIEDIL